MNPTIDNLQPPPQPPQPHRPSTSCDRHPAESFTGFCPTCLCERLAVLDSSISAVNSAAKKPPTAAASAALKAIFKPSSSSSSSSFLPELRRTKSFSATKNNEGLFAGVFEPQRRSCDVRVRNTLWSLFSQDDSKKEPLKSKSKSPLTSPRVSTSSVKNDENVIQNDVVLEENLNLTNLNVNLANFSARNSNARPIEEIIEEEEEEEDTIVIEPEREEEIVLEEEKIEESLKSMKEHIDVDSNPVKKGSSGRDLKEIAGSFWSAASVFSKKLQKWRHKQKMKKRRNGVGPTLPVEKPIGRQFRETQSEIADYGYGRRSCDTDPRFSLDAGRMSFDDPPRYSFDEPRASWDGYLIGKSFPRMPTMVSVFEDAPVGSSVGGGVSRSDAHIPVVEDTMPLPMNAINEDESVPGGSAQTRDYYSDSSSRRRKSLDRSNSIRRTAAAVVAEIDELKSSVSNAKVSPATVDIFHGPKLVVPEANLRDSNSNSLRDDCSESFEMGFRDNGSVVGNGERKGGKKSRRWSWNIWGLIHRRSVSKDEDDDRYSRANGVERSLSESWQELRGERNGDVRGGFNPKVLRSNSSVSWRNSQGFGGVGNGTFGGGRKSNVETNGNGRKKKEEFVLERNRSARYSPNNIDNGLLRFYLTPMRSSSRRGGWGKNKANQAHSIARSVLRLY